MKRIVVHLIAGLAKGGAETMLYQVIKYQSDREITNRVISLGASSYYEQPLRDLGVNVVVVPLIKRPLYSLNRIRKELAHVDTLCCWMYHANFIGYYLGKLAHVPHIIWCIRHSNLDPALNKRQTLKINALCAKRSGKINAILYNGNLAREVHERIGYNPKKGAVLDNGCDCVEYTHIPEAREQLCRELGIDSQKKIVLSVTKNHPIKDVPTFIRAFRKLHMRLRDTVAIICGEGIDSEDERLKGLCEENGLIVGKNVFLLGMRHDVPILLSACDLYVLHSAGEAFPNALLQAMSCGCLCLSTDVGDARRILSQADCIIPLREPKQLADKMEELLSLSEEQTQFIRDENRARVLDEFEIRQIVKRYEELY